MVVSTVEWLDRASLQQFAGFGLSQDDVLDGSTWRPWFWDTEHDFMFSTKLDTSMSIFSPRLAPLFKAHENFPKGSAAEAQSTAIIFGKEWVESSCCPLA